MKLLKITSAKYLGDYSFHLEFNNGTAGEANITNELWGEVFEPLKDDSKIKGFHIENGTLEWPNGADLAPEYLYELVEQGKIELLEK
jgi:hypothetical protein